MKNWTENLKVGDYVFMSWRMGTSLRKVEKITPKGNIKVNGILFNKDGSERGGDVWSKRYLSKATSEAIKSFREELTIKKAINLMREIKSITIEQANKIIELLDPPTEKVCTGKRCPMQVGYDVKNCKDNDCIYRTETE